MLLDINPWKIQTENVPESNDMLFTTAITHQKSNVRAIGGSGVTNMLN